MPFDTVGRNTKRIRNDFNYIFEDLEEDDTLYHHDSTATFFNTINDSPYKSSKTDNYLSSTFNISNPLDSSSPISLLQKSYGLKLPYNSNNNNTFIDTINNVNKMDIVTTPEDNDSANINIDLFDDDENMNINSNNISNNNNNNNNSNMNNLNMNNNPLFLRSPSLSSCSSTLTTSSPSVPFSMGLHPTSTSSIPNSITPPIDLESLHTALSKFQLSYTESGIHMEANISNASELRSLLDAFKKLSCTTTNNNHSFSTATTSTSTTNTSHDDDCNNNSFFNYYFNNNNNSSNDTPFFSSSLPSSPMVSQQEEKKRRNSVVIYRNKSCKSVPVNLFQLVGLLGQALHAHSNHYGGISTLRQIADACVNTYFSCWIRYSPILNKQEFMKWYYEQENPQDTLVVNALCSLVFRHTVTHHGIPVLSHFLHNPDMVHEQEEFYFNRARDALAQSFDTPDRFTIVALAFLCCKAEPSRRLQYGGLAISLLQQLNIYPRMVPYTNNHNNNEDNDDNNNNNMDDDIQVKKNKIQKMNDQNDTLLYNNNDDDENINNNNINNEDDDIDDIEMENELKIAFQLEMDTRLWWFVWQIDFSLWTAGLPKITPLLQYPNQTYDQVDVPRVFEQDIDDNEMAIHCFSHALKLWRTQGSIITTLYEQDSELTSEQLLNFEQDLMTIYNELPDCFKLDVKQINKNEMMNNNCILSSSSISHHQPLPSNFGIIDENEEDEQQKRDMDFVKLRIKLEYNASRIILHRLFIPDVGEPRPSESALQSLGICLHVALDQLEVLEMASRAELRCSFDRDELWRIGKLFSTALDIYRTAIDQQVLKTIIGESITPIILENSLAKAFDILKRTPENRVGTKSWIQLVDFIQMEIKRHQLYSRSSSSPSSSKNKNNKNIIESKKNGKQVSSPTKSSLSIITFDTPNIKSNPHPYSPISPTTSSNRRKSSTSSNSNNNHQTKQFSQTFVQATGSPFEQKNQPRFRYFNPRKMNKFLFIDESR